MAGKDRRHTSPDYARGLDDTEAQHRDEPYFAPGQDEPETSSCDEAGPDYAGGLDDDERMARDERRDFARGVRAARPRWRRF